jgi:hypothetical protein
MLCYKDKTFCPFWVSCTAGESCPAALTDQVIEAANLWMDNPLICQYTKEPACYDKKL